MKFSVMGSLLCGFACVASSAFANEWFADDSRPAGSGDGKSEATAFHTIQEAVDAAADGDTVTVLPGVYDEGGYVRDNGYVSRVAILDKVLTLRSKSGKAADTHIVGAYDPDGCYLDGDPAKRHYDCIGPKAVQCVTVSGANGTRIEGFTIRGGACHEVPAGDNTSGTGGGVYVMGASRNVFVADCVIADCVASRGGGMRYGTAIRCLFEGNCAYYGSGQVARETNLYNCMIRRNAVREASDVLFWGCKLDHCTVAQNPNGAVFNGCTLVNVLEALNGGTTGVYDASNVGTNCLVRGVTTERGDHFSPASESVIATEACNLFAPALGDFRLTAESEAVTWGLAEPTGTVFPVPAEDFNLDFAGNPIPTEGMVAVGCLQEAATPAGGMWRFLNPMIANGYNMRVSSYYYASNATMAVKTQMVPVEGREIFSFICASTTRFPMEDGSTWLLAPPEGTEVACNFHHATNILYVAKDGDNSDGRSWATAFRTIQQAIDAAPYAATAATDSLDVRTIIRVGKGEYTAADGTKTGKSQKNVVYVANRRIRVIGSGNHESVIRGAADDAVEQDAAPWGCGENAVRCLAAENTSICCFQNFTFADGHNTLYAGDSAYGGGVYGGGSGYTFICDSVFTNCVGNRGAAIYSGKALRCRFVDCVDYYCWTRAATTMGCVFEVLDRPPRDAIIGQDANAYGCTVIGRATAKDSLLRSDGKLIYNTIGVHGKNTPAAATCGGNVIWDWNTLPNDNFVKADPALASEALRDFRLLSPSEALGRGTTDGDFWKMFEGDFHGKAPLFVNGLPTPGACQEIVAAVKVEAPTEGTLSPTGVIPVEAGETLTVTYTPDVHNILGFVVDGVTNLTSAFTWSYTAPTDGPIPPVPVVTAVASPHWYVSPKGDDKNSGWTPEEPMGTLVGVMAKVVEGDIVHAAAGTYSKNHAIPPSAGTTVWLQKVRVVVPKNVMLVADEGPEKTFIVGEPDTTETAVAGKGGCGPNATQGVFLSDLAKISGFTVCNGYTDGDAADGPNHSGGGIFVNTSGNSVYCGVAENCIISNCWGRSGAGTYRGKFIGCQILENHSYSSNPAGRYSSFYNCYIDRNYGSPTYQIYYALENCTFGPDNLTGNGGRSTGLVVCHQPQGGAVAKNCVFMDRIQRTDANRVIAKNCIFRNDDASYYPADEADRVDCTLMSVADMKMTPGTCVPAVDSPLVDKADETLMSDFAKTMDASCVAGGGQRVYNGAPDFGAFEHDWRPEYATMLGVTRVDAADPKVVGNVGDAFVTIGAGSLKLTMVGGGPTQRNVFSVPFSFNDGGTVSVAMNGEPVGTYKRDFGKDYLLKLKNRESQTTFDFDYDGAEDGLCLSRLTRTVQGLILLVR